MKTVPLGHSTLRVPGIGLGRIGMPPIHSPPT